LCANIFARFCSGGNGCILECLGRRAIVKFCVLASGSSGNAALLATEKTRILVDAGLSMRELGKRMASIDEDLETVDAILITHEHSDHIAGCAVLARRLKKPKPFHMTKLTAPAIDWEHSLPVLEPFQAGASFQIGDIEVQSFSIPHDAIDPVGFTFRAQGVKIGLANELGYIPESVKYHLRDCDLLMIEANHDVEMLKVGPYPWSVKQRVLSRVGHLSNLMTSDFLAQDLDARTEFVVLGHLSEANNHPEIARATAMSALEERGLFVPKLAVAEQSKPSEVFQF
jgi:phosphoribosyl 1,2-cyclic phosphodiesterase